MHSLFGSIRLTWIGIVLAMIPLSNLLSQTSDPYQEARDRLVSQVLVPGGVTDERVLRVIASTARHEFVSEKYKAQAYYDLALPIGDKQTISSPYIVAVMTAALLPDPNDVVLEIGTGSGYQAAVLSPLVREVYSIEIVESLGKQAASVLAKLGYKNVHTRVGDGFKGWEEAAPFDKIIVTCSPEEVPQPLIDQLKENGMMIIPVGERYQQTLYMMRKKNGKLEREALRPTLFVPMTGTAEDQRQVLADPANPKLMNGGFEDELIGGEHVPGWYYQFGMHVGESNDIPPGSKRHIVFENQVAHRPALLLQGIPLDGRLIRKIRLSGWVSTTNVKSGGTDDEKPAMVIQFLDENRNRILLSHVGPFTGTRDWKKEHHDFDVPAAAREALITLGMFGATGTTRFDNIELEVLKRK